MHPDFEKYRASGDDTEQMNFRIPKALAAIIRVHASLEGDSIANLMTEAAARLVEARQEEPLADPALIEQRIARITTELDVLRNLQAGQTEQ